MTSFCRLTPEDSIAKPLDKKEWDFLLDLGIFQKSISGKHTFMILTCFVLLVRGPKPALPKRRPCIQASDIYTWGIY